MMWVHHFMFACISFYTPYLGVLPELTLFALAMETSTPALEMMSIARCVEGFNGKALNLIKSVFALSFILSRVVLFGYGLFRSLLFWRDAEEQQFYGLADRVYGLIILQVCFMSGVEMY